MMFDFFPWKKNDEDYRKVIELFELKEYENSVIFNFGIELQEELVKDDTDSNIDIVFNGGNFPDAMLYNETTGETVKIEFESRSSHFKFHRHDPHDCDLIICSIDDWDEVFPNEKCPLPTYIVGSKKIR